MSVRLSLSASLKLHVMFILLIRMCVAPHSPHHAHLEVHFRLLRHDMVSPLAQAIQAMHLQGKAQLQLQDRSSSSKGSGRAGRLDLGNQRLFAYRQVALEEVAFSRQSGVELMVRYIP